MPTLKKWNGRAVGRRKGKYYIAAFSQAQAVELLVIASNIPKGATTEIKQYFSKGTWGSNMNHIEPTEPCIYYIPSDGKNPVPKLIHSIAVDAAKKS